MIASAKKPKRHLVSSQAEVASFCDVSVNSVAQWRSKGMPGKPGRYDLHEIIVWLTTEGPWKNRARESQPITDDPLLLESGEDSPALERYRLARAKLSELELEERKNALVPRDRVRNGLGRFASILRQFGERLGKRYGPEATLSLNDTLDDCQRVVDDEFGGDGL